MIFGYARVSTASQNIERQIRNISAYNPKARIYQESGSGRKISRPEFDKLLKKVKANDTIIFDSVSRMSRNAEEGFKLYQKLYNNHINLVFLKERHIDTSSYKEALEGIITTKIDSGDSSTNELVNSIMDAVNKFMMHKVEADIFKAFEQSQKEVDDLSQRTKEGIETARLNGKKLGRPEGTYETKKSKEMKEKITKMSKDFDGNMKDTEIMEMLKLARNTYYKYKRELNTTDFHTINGLNIVVSDKKEW